MEHMVCVSYSDKIWKETWWDHVCDPTWWAITVAALIDMMYFISWNSNLMWAPVVPNGTSSRQANSVRTGGVCVNTAETIFPSELTEKTHLCWRGTDDQRRTCRKMTYGARGGGIGTGAKEKGGTVCRVSLSESDRERAKGPNYRMRNKWQERVYKRKRCLALYRGAWDWEDWTALEFFQTSLMGLMGMVQLLITLGCKEQGLHASTRSNAEVITSNDFTSRQISWNTERIQSTRTAVHVLVWPRRLGLKMNHDR